MKAAPISEKSAMNKLYCVRYRYLGEVYGTVVSAPDGERAKIQFQREHPNVEVVEVLD